MNSVVIWLGVTKIPQAPYGAYENVHLSGSHNSPGSARGARHPRAVCRQEMTSSPGLPLFHEYGSWSGLGATWDPGQCSGVCPSIPCWFASSCPCSLDSPAALLSAQQHCQSQDTATHVNGSKHKGGLHQQ